MYRNWDNEQFNEKFRINEDAWEYMLNIIGPFTKKTPTNLVPNPTEAGQQLTFNNLTIGPWMRFCRSK